MAVNHFDCVGHIVLFDSVYMIIHSDTFDKICIGGDGQTIYFRPLVKSA